MAASHTLSHSLAICKSGVLVLSGYGIRVQVNAGHLVAHDGIADERRTIRLAFLGTPAAAVPVPAAPGGRVAELLLQAPATMMSPANRASALVERWTNSPYLL